MTNPETTRQEIQDLWRIMDRLGSDYRRAHEHLELIEDQMSEVRKQLHSLGETDA